jgi:hypothetical protein
MPAILDDLSPPRATGAETLHWQPEATGAEMDKNIIPEGMGYLIIDVAAVVLLIAVLAWGSIKYRAYRRRRHDRPTD